MIIRHPCYHDCIQDSSGSSSSSSRSSLCSEKIKLFVRLLKHDLMVTLPQLYNLYLLVIIAIVIRRLDGYVIVSTSVAKSLNGKCNIGCKCDSTY